MLLSALGQPLWPQYPTLPAKAAALHYSLNTDHPYVDGNKRFALAAMETFLYLNGAQLVATDEEATQLALGVASGDWTAADCTTFVQSRTFRFRWSTSRIVRWLSAPPQADIAIRSELLDRWNNEDSQDDYHRYTRVHEAIQAVAGDEEQSTRGSEH